MKLIKWAVARGWTIELTQEEAENLGQACQDIVDGVSKTSQCYFGIGNLELVKEVDNDIHSWPKSRLGG